MIKLLIVLMLPLLLNASQILSYNVYDRTDRVDVMITFDTPFEGKIKQSTTSTKIIIKLEGASIEAKKVKELSSRFLTSIHILPSLKYTKIIATVPPSIQLKASKTSDAYGLRLRFSTKKTSVVEQSRISKANNVNNYQTTSSLPTKQPDDMSTSYYLVIAVLLLGIFILFAVKTKMPQVGQKQKAKSWLFKTDKEVHSHTDSDVSIRFQKNINSQNSVLMLDFGAQSYLVLMGDNNILLDKFTDNKPVTQDDFNTILQNRHEELDNFLNDEPKAQEKDPMQIYREKAANISYTT
ncbi:hypothetical protein JHD48_08985 [Sulfurimonas sp. SAG-AH-194-I05]|nr:hypothetical protein [Sulfurimonas sp. SAG-AH-194-I05]MDF1875868.1 hypothetical protein [Sulfurimonas sp. SAG-AH-194-I05]